MNLAKKYKQLFEGKVRSNDTILLKEALNLSSVKSQLLALSKKYPGYADGLADYMDSGIPEDAYRDIQGGNKATAEKFYNLAVAIVHNVDPTFDVSDGKPFAPGDPNEPKGFDTESEAFEKIGFFEGKIRSNDAALLTEKDAKTYLPLIQADAKLKQLGLAKVEINSSKELIITFKTKLPDGEYYDGKGPVPKGKQITDAIWDVIPDEVIDGGLGVGSDGKSYEIEFKQKSSSTSTSKAEVRNLETDDEFYDVVATIYTGAGDDNTNMTDDITDELGDYYDDIYNNPNNKKLQNAYDDLRSTIDGTNDEQYEAAKALLDLLR